MEMVLHPESQPRVGHPPLASTYGLRELVLSLPSTKPYMVGIQAK